MSLAPELRPDRHGPTLVVHLGASYDSLDESRLQALERDLLACADLTELRNLVIDLSDTKYLGSRFIEVLFRAHNRIKRKGGRFALSSLQPYPAEVIKVSRLDAIWPLFPTAEDAVKALAPVEKQKLAPGR